MRVFLIAVLGFAALASVAVAESFDDGQTLASEDSLLDALSDINRLPNDVGHGETSSGDDEDEEEVTFVSTVYYPQKECSRTRRATTENWFVPPETATYKSKTQYTYKTIPTSDLDRLQYKGPHLLQKATDSSTSDGRLMPLIAQLTATFRLGLATAFNPGLAALIRAAILNNLPAALRPLVQIAFAPVVVGRRRRSLLEIDDNAIRVSDTMIDELYPGLLRTRRADQCTGGSNFVDVYVVARGLEAILPGLFRWLRLILQAITFLQSNSDVDCLDGPVDGTLTIIGDSGVETGSVGQP
eukprot:m.484069 g.484069  ORF g.484069 m.484069 type:complete len:299 (-) comp23176_c0_seq1:229-1125(-)